MTLTLNDTILSGLHKRVYALKGEKVKLVAIRGEVLIVENAKGIRFPVLISQTDYSLLKPTSNAENEKNVHP